jgi:hypothetical protein
MADEPELLGIGETVAAALDGAFAVFGPWAAGRLRLPAMELLAR